MIGAVCSHFTPCTTCFLQPAPTTHCVATTAMSASSCGGSLLCEWQLLCPLRCSLKLSILERAMHAENNKAFRRRQEVTAVSLETPGDFRSSVAKDRRFGPGIERGYVDACKSQRHFQQSVNLLCRKTTMGWRTKNEQVTCLEFGRFTSPTRTTFTSPVRPLPMACAIFSVFPYMES